MSPSTRKVSPLVCFIVTPPRFTAYQGMDAFFHAAESVINKNEHPMGEMFALKAIELIAQNLMSGTSPLAACVYRP